jgi:hypothetical protein
MKLSQSADHKRERPVVRSDRVCLLAGRTRCGGGTTVVTVTATDAYGNVATKTFLVTVVKH